MVVLAGLWVEPELRGSRLDDRVSSIILGLVPIPADAEPSEAARIMPLTSPTENLESLSICIFLVVREDPEIAAVLAEIRAKNPDLPVYVIKVDDSACRMPQLDHLCITASKLWSRDRRVRRLLRGMNVIKARSKGPTPSPRLLLVKIRADLQGLSYYLPDESMAGDVG